MMFQVAQRPALSSNDGFTLPRRRIGLALASVEQKFWFEFLVDHYDMFEMPLSHMYGISCSFRLGLNFSCFVARNIDEESEGKLGLDWAAKKM